MSSIYSDKISIVIKMIPVLESGQVWHWVVFLSKQLKKCLKSHEQITLKHGNTCNHGLCDLLCRKAAVELQDKVDKNERNSGEKWLRQMFEKFSQDKQRFICLKYIFYTRSCKRTQNCVQIRWNCVLCVPWFRTQRNSSSFAVVALFVLLP